MARPEAQGRDAVAPARGVSPGVLRRLRARPRARAAVAVSRGRDRLAGGDRLGRGADGELRLSRLRRRLLRKLVLLEAAPARLRPVQSAERGDDHPGSRAGRIAALTGFSRWG